MLVHLTISNFAIISHLDVQFKAGLNILSGETGAGKSIIISAVNLILGGRAYSDLIRTGSEEAKVEALFILPRNASAGDLLKDMGFPFEEELLIKRHIPKEGRNKIVINGSLATLQTLSRIGLLLMNVSGQHEHQLLLRPENHLYLLDDFGGLTEERLQLNERFARYQSIREKAASLQRRVHEGEERQELARFQMDEIDRAGIKEGEDGALEKEKKRLQHAEQLMELVKETYQDLYEREGSILSGLSSCLRKLDKAASMDHSVKGAQDSVMSAKVLLEDVALELRGYQHTLLSNPQRLNEVEERIQLINRLKRKYGQSLEEIRRSRDQISHAIEDLEEKRKELASLQKESKNLEGELMRKSTLLSEKRRGVAAAFEEAIKSELRLLDMAGTQFEVRFQQDEVASASEQAAMKGVKSDGSDRVEFMLSPNIGEELKPLARIASGGELSRIMLAMKTVLGRTTSVETIIFDEVDSGIGGGTAEVVGEKLRSLAEFHQIICITHLPQIASKGPTHFLVRKRIMDGRADTVIAELNSEERVKEIARLLGGKSVTPRAIAHAKELLES
jgi:DNA repair protein RecN (Recombination protein N)